MSTQNKKTFYIDTEKEKGVTAGGVVLYRFIGKEMELLLIETNGMYEDLGGKADTKDRDILSTVCREAHEESNEIINKRKLKARLKTAPHVYIQKSINKY